MALEVDAGLVGIVKQLLADNERHRRQITALQTLLNGLTGSTDGSRRPAASERTPIRRRRKISAAARRAIGQRMKAYWSKKRMETAKANAAGRRAKGRAKKGR
jgi:hypothetical protein